MDRINCGLIEIKLAGPDVGEDAMSFTGYGAVFNNVDAGGDMIEPGAFAAFLSDMKSGKQRWPAMMGALSDVAYRGVNAHMSRTGLMLSVVPEAGSILEIKTIIEKQGQAWEEFKRTNDELIKAKADGKAVSDIETKLAKIGTDIDGLSETKKMIEDFMAKATAPGTGTKADEDLAVEVKGFNLMMRAEYQSKGKVIPAELDADGYKQYKSAFFKLAAGVPIDNLSTDERKAMQAGSDPDGGYLLPHSTVGRMVTKLFEQSTMRQLATVQTIGTDKIEGIVDNNEADAGWVSELS